jgi:prepilin peptidase CpaA
MNVTELAAIPGLQHLAALAIAAAACGFDVPTRRIPNWLTFGGAIAAFSFALLVAGPQACGQSVLGWAAGLAIFLPLFLLGGMGAGDVKLLACVGAWLGAPLAMWTALYAALAGGLLAIVVALANGYLRTALDNLYLLVSHFRVVGVRPHPELTLARSSGPRLPYAVPIAAGVAAALWLQ